MHRAVLISVLVGAGIVEASWSGEGAGPLPCFALGGGSCDGLSLVTMAVKVAAAKKRYLRRSRLRFCSLPGPANTTKPSL